jgi:hypothetical protein
MPSPEQTRHPVYAGHPPAGTGHLAFTYGARMSAVVKLEFTNGIAMSLLYPVPSALTTSVTSLHRRCQHAYHHIGRGNLQVRENDVHLIWLAGRGEASLGNKVGRQWKIWDRAVQSIVAVGPEVVSCHVARSDNGLASDDAAWLGHLTNLQAGEMAESRVDAGVGNEAPRLDGLGALRAALSVKPFCVVSGCTHVEHCKNGGNYLASMPLARE